MSAYSEQTFSKANFRQPPHTSQNNVKPYNIRGGFMNASIFSGRKPSRQSNIENYNNTEVNNVSTRSKDSMLLMQNLKPDLQSSTYGSSFTSGKLRLHKESSIKNAEEYLTLQKRVS